MSYHPGKFGGHRHSGSRDGFVLVVVMVFVCHVALRDHVIRAYCDFMVRSFSK